MVACVVQVLSDDQMFALLIDQENSFGKFFADKKHLIQTTVEDRFELMVSADVEATTELEDMWAI